MKKVLLVLGREQIAKDSKFYADVLATLDLRDCELVFDPLDGIRYRYQQILGTRHFRGKSFLLRLILGMYVAVFIGQWRNVAQLLTRSISPMDFRMQYTEHVIRGLQASSYRVIVIARSAGGIVATHLADTLKLAAVICLGYPFRHPALGDSPFRTAHLRSMKTPVIIIQGNRDEYGASNDLDGYVLADCIEIVSIDATHDLCLSFDDIQRVKSNITSTFQYFDLDVCYNEKHL